MNLAVTGRKLQGYNDMVHDLTGYYIRNAGSARRPTLIYVPD